MQKSSDMQKKLESLGLTVWGEDIGKPRIYINSDAYKDVFGLEVKRYKTGNVQSAFLNGEKISNNQAHKILLNISKAYYDCKAKKILGTDMDVIL